MDISGAFKDAVCTDSNSPRRVGSFGLRRCWGERSLQRCQTVALQAPSIFVDRRHIGYEEADMMRALPTLLAIALLAACTTSPAPTPAKYANCKGLSWSWCIGYHGGR